MFLAVVRDTFMFLNQPWTHIRQKFIILIRFMRRKRTSIYVNTVLKTLLLRDLLPSTSKGSIALMLMTNSNIHIDHVKPLYCIYL